MDRVVEKEWLDELRADDPRAERSRRDIQRINRLTGHDRIIAHGLTRCFGTNRPREIADLGAGNGRLLLSVAQRLGWNNVRATLVDRVNGVEPQVVREFGKLTWTAEIEICDALNWLRSLDSEKIDAVIANHFFHQLADDELTEMFRLLAKSASAVIAAEPRRGIWPLLCSRFVWLIGGASVTQNDAPVSVRAGFHGHELSVLWPEKHNWELIERRAGWFSHLFVARRRI